MPWQGVLIAAAAAVALRLLRSPRHRYAVGVAGMVLCAAAPVVTFLFVTPPASVSIDISATDATGDLLRDLDRLDALLAAVEVGPERPAATAPTWAERLRLVQPYLLAVWFVGAGACGLRIAVGAGAVLSFGCGRRPLPPEWEAIAIRLAGRLGLRRPRAFVSAKTAEAVAVGLLRPAVLLPAAWLGRVPPEVIEAVLAHELGHLRRHDLWVNLLQRCVEAALFYHPAVWWLSRRVRAEREFCCDESAAAATGRAAYARALEYVAADRAAAGRPAFLTAFAAGIGGDSMALLTRVRRVLGTDPVPPRGRLSEGLLALAAPLAIVAAITTFDPPSAAADGPAPSRAEPADKSGVLEAALAELRAEVAAIRREVRELKTGAVNPHAAEPRRETPRAEAGTTANSARVVVSEKEMRLEASLDRSVSLHLDGVPLHEALAALEAKIDGDIVIDRAGLMEEGVTPDVPVSVDLNDVRVRSALRVILSPLSLGYMVEDEVVKITSEVRTKGPRIVLSYPVADLVVPEPQAAEPESKKTDGDSAGTGGRHAIDLDLLVDLIRGSVRPESWDHVGGYGVIRKMETTRSLVIHQTRDVHGEITDLLDQIRRQMKAARDGEANASTRDDSRAAVEAARRAREEAQREKTPDRDESEDRPREAKPAKEPAPDNDAATTVPTDAPLAAVRIEGNDTIPAAAVLGLIQARPRWPLSDRLVREDVAALYATKWFSSVEPFVRPTAAGPVLAFRVTERPIVRRSEYRGNEKVATKWLAASAGLRPGSPFDTEANLAAARRIEGHYRDRGLQATVRLIKGGSPEDREVVFEIIEGGRLKGESHRSIPAKLIA